MFEVIWGRSRRRQRSRGRHSTRGSSRRWRSRIGASVTSPVAGRYRGGGRRSTARRTTRSPEGVVMRQKESSFCAWQLDAFAF